MTVRDELANLVSVILLVVLIATGVPVEAGEGQDNVPQFDARDLGSRATNGYGISAEAPPVPLPEDCDDVTPPGETPPACCMYGYVYYDGVPSEGVSVRIESSYGTVSTLTAIGVASVKPYYRTDLSSAPLLASPGDVITVTATYGGNSASTSYQVSPDGQQVDVAIVINSVPVFGDGSDGNLVVSGLQYVDDVRTALSSSANAGQEMLNVVNTSGFLSGDQVLVHQSRGASAGTYEFGIVESAASGSLLLQHELQNNYYQDGDARTQVLRVPNYQNVTVQGGAVLAVHAWDGSTGGIAAIASTARVEIQDGGTLSVRGKGFRGGSGAIGYPDRLGEQGEGESGPGGTLDRNPNGAGGGGGGFGADNHSRGGGGGGYGTGGGNGGGGSVEAGIGGYAWGQADLSVAAGFGGGGGSGSHSHGGEGTAGGNGGGLVILFAREIQLLGTNAVDAHGNDGVDATVGGYSSGGGGGAGGGVLLKAQSVDTGSVFCVATGGTGGTADEGNGGNGGAGRIHIEFGSLAGSTNPAASTQQREFHTSPLVTIHAIYPRPAIQGQDIVTFRGSAVDNDEDGTAITQYVWRSDLDGVLSTQPTFTLDAADLSPGSHTVYFKARDDEGEWSEELSTSLTINTAQGSPPNASFTVNPTSGYIDTIFAFDASGCSDNEDPVSALEVRWDWEDDGVYDTSWSTTKTITHAYTITGTHTIRLEVRDTDNLTDSTTRSVTINPPPGETTWAFLLYLAGDNNLHSWMQRALDNLEAATHNPNATVLALLDGHGNGNAWRYHVQPGGVYQDGVNRWFLDEVDMSAPQTLSDFVNWARDNYPAQHYYLAVADHGRGTTGIAWDEATGSQQFITVAELRTALRDATMDGAKPLDVVHYDACLMGMIEDAYQVKDYAGYLVASQNLGWSIFAYDRYTSQVGADTTPEGLVTKVVDEYHNALAGYPRTVSALDLGQVGAVEDAVSALAGALRASLSANKYYVQNTRDATQKFDSRDYFTINNDDEYLDVYDLARLLKRNVPDASVQSAAQDVMDAVAAFVVAERHESGSYQDYPYWDLDDAHGVSVYFPPRSGGWDYNDYMAHIFQFTVDSEWDEFLQDYFGLMGLPPETPVEPGLPPMLEKPYTVFLPIIQK